MSDVDLRSCDPASVASHRGSIADVDLRGMAERLRLGHCSSMGNHRFETSMPETARPARHKLMRKGAFAALPILLSLFASPNVIGERRASGPQAFVRPVLTAHEKLPHPCVFASIHGSALFTGLGNCLAPSDRPNSDSFAFSTSASGTAAIDQFEADLQHGTFVTRQTDLTPDRTGAVPLTRSYVSQATSPSKPAYGFGPNMEDSLHLTPASSKRIRRNSGVNLAHLQGPRTGWVHLAYDHWLRVREARDDQANAVRYIYNQDGMLSYAFNSSGVIRHYIYDHSLMTGIEDENGNTLVHNLYRDGILCAQQFANGDMYSYEYNYAPGALQPESVTVTLPGKTERVISFATPNSSRF